MNKAIIFLGFSLIILFSCSCENSKPASGDTNTYNYSTTTEEAVDLDTRKMYSAMAPEREEDILVDISNSKQDVEKPEGQKNTEGYDKIVENPFQNATQSPVSTFSIDVDNASYSNVRRFLSYSQLPNPGAVRIEEMINYFDYDYPQPQGKHPFSINTEIAAAPWNPEHHLIHIGLQGKELDYNDIKPSNLVFLIDASGSMSNENKLPLLKKALKLLLNELDDKDKVSIVAYAGAAGLVLEPTPASQKSKSLLGILRWRKKGESVYLCESTKIIKICNQNLIALLTLNGNL